MGRVARSLTVVVLAGLSQPGCKGSRVAATSGDATAPAAASRPAVAVADVMPPERRTTWNPGIPGGIPARTTVCATVSAAAYGNGVMDATAGIQAAIDACPPDEVVRLSAGEFAVNGTDPIRINKGIVLRGAGASQTRLTKTTTTAEGEQTTAQIPQTLLTLSVSKEEAEKVTFAAANGEIALALRTPDSTVTCSSVGWVCGAIL